MSVITDNIEERLRAYLLPRKPVTADELSALSRAVDAQAAFEASSGLGDLPAGVQSVKNDGLSVTFREGGSGGSGYTRDTISPVAWAILRNAGLIRYDLPTAKKP